jgi:hypothetical protein
MIILGVTKAKQIKDVFNRLKGAAELVLNEGGSKQKRD